MCDFIFRPVANRKPISYSDITLDGITDYGILIEQNYDGGDLDGDITSGIPITDVTLDGVTGTVESDGYNIAIACASCTSWTWSSVSVTGGESYDCQGEPDGVTC